MIGLGSDKNKLFHSHYQAKLVKPLQLLGCLLSTHISLLSPLFDVFSLTNMVPSGQWPHSGIAVFPWWEKLSSAMLHHLFSALEESPNTHMPLHLIVLFFIFTEELNDKKTLYKASMCWNVLDYV